jgi:hypothetical protein
MTRRPLARRCALATLPCCGAATLAGALALYGPVPDAQELEEARRTLTDLQAQRRDLQLEPPPRPDALTDRLPLALSVGALLQRLERAARTAGVRAVSFGSEGDDPIRHEQTAAPDSEADTDSAVANGLDPTRGPEPSPHAGAQPEVLRCQITIAASYQAVVHFLGLIEALPAVTRVRNLTLVPTGSEVTATIGLAAYAYAGDGNEAAAAPGAEASR